MKWALQYSKLSRDKCLGWTAQLVTGPRAVPLDAADCSEAGLAVAAGVLSVRSDFPVVKK